MGLLDPGCQVTVRGGGFSPTKRHDSRSTRLVKEATRPSYATTRHWHVSSALGHFWVCLVKVEPAWHGKQANGRLETIFEMICIFFSFKRFCAVVMELFSSSTMYRNEMARAASRTERRAEAVPVGLFRADQSSRAMWLANRLWGQWPQCNGFDFSLSTMPSHPLLFQNKTAVFRSLPPLSLSVTGTHTYDLSMTDWGH